MFQIIGRPISFVAHFTAGGAPHTAGGIVCDVRRSGVVVATDVAVSNDGGGFYRLAYASTGTPGTYEALFRYTGDWEAIGLDFQVFPSVWFVGEHWAQAVYEKTLLIGATVSVPPAGTVAAIADALFGETDVRFVQPFIASGHSIAGWTTITFTVKMSFTEDDDDGALIVIRASNPANVDTDGILYFRGKAVDPADALRTAGAIIVSTSAPDTAFEVRLTARAMDIPPCPDNDPFGYEVNTWIAGDKEQTAKGAFVVNRSLRRSEVAP